MRTFLPTPNSAEPVFPLDEESSVYRSLSHKRVIWRSQAGRLAQVQTRTFKPGRLTLWIKFRAHVVSYADNFVILSRGHAEEALAWTTAVMTKLGLTLRQLESAFPRGLQELGTGAVPQCVGWVEILRTGPLTPAAQPSGWRTLRC